MSEPIHPHPINGPTGPDEYVVIAWSEYYGRWYIAGSYATLASARGRRTNLAHESAKIVRATGWKVVQ